MVAFFIPSTPPVVYPAKSVTADERSRSHVKEDLKVKNIIDICKDFGIEIPTDKHADFLKAVNGEYKTVSDYNKQVEKTNAATKRAETAEEALKGFEGIDPAQVSKQLEEANKKVKEAQEEAQKQIAERDFNDALKAELESIQFTSAAARKAVEAEIRGAGLKLKDGKILGLTDLIDQIKKSDASAFVDEHQQQLEGQRAKFTAPNGGTPTPGKKYTMGEIMKMKNENPALDIKQFMNNGGNN